MRDIRPADGGSQSPPPPEPALGARLIASSLLLYLLVVTAERCWALLNSDVADLVRRLH